MGELAKILLNSLARRGLVECYGFISNLSPAKERARLARGTLDQLGMTSIPVAIGADMISSTSGSYEFKAPYMADIDTVKENGVALFVEILEGLEEGITTTLVCLSGLTDAWELLQNNKALFKAKIGRVVIMGGVQVEGDDVKLDADGFMMPDNAQNNMYDVASSQKLYRELQKECIPMTIVTRWAAYAAKLPFTVYDSMAETGHPVGVKLAGTQRHSLEHLWKRACFPEGDPGREGLPPRCDKPWFCKTFLGGLGVDRDGSESIWDLASMFQAYDPLALVAAVHAVRARFLRPTLVNVKGTEGTASHEILGMNEKNHGVHNSGGLADVLHQSLLEGLTFPSEAKSPMDHRSPATARSSSLDILETDPDFEGEATPTSDSKKTPTSEKKGNANE